LNKFTADANAEVHKATYSQVI